MTASAGVVAQFTTLMESTPISNVSGQMDVINDVLSRNQIMPRFLRGRGREDIIQTGPKLKDRIFLEGYSNFRKYGPHTTHTYQNRQTGTDHETGWAMYTEEMVWTDPEIQMNVVPGLSAEGQINALKKVKYQKEQRLMTSIIEGLEDLPWAVPNWDGMENLADGDERDAMSLLALINEYSNGLPGDIDDDTWTKVQDIAPATYSNWVPQQVTYDADIAAGPPAGIQGQFDGLIHAFEYMYAALQFRAPATGQEFAEGNNWDRQFIATSLTGRVRYIDACRANGDLWNASGRGPNDPNFARPTFAGHAIEDVDALGSVAFYDPSGSPTYPLVNELNASNAGPRYYWINTNYLTLYVYAGRMLKKHKVKEPDNQIDVYVQPVSIWLNFWCKSRRRHGVVYPT